MQLIIYKLEYFDDWHASCIRTAFLETTDINANSNWQRKSHLLLKLKVEITHLPFVTLKSLRC